MLRIGDGSNQADGSPSQHDMEANSSIEVRKNAQSNIEFYRVKLKDELTSLQLSVLDAIINSNIELLRHQFPNEDFHGLGRRPIFDVVSASKTELINFICTHVRLNHVATLMFYGALLTTSIDTILKACKKYSPYYIFFNYRYSVTDSQAKTLLKYITEKRCITKHKLVHLKIESGEKISNETAELLAIIPNTTRRPVTITIEQNPAFENRKKIESLTPWISADYSEEKTNLFLQEIKTPSNPFIEITLRKPLIDPK